MKLILLFALLFAATFAGNWRGWYSHTENAWRMAHSWNGKDYHGEGWHTDAPRELAEEHIPRGTPIYLLIYSDKGELKSVERAAHITLSWARSPDKISFGDISGIKEEDAVIAYKYYSRKLPDKFVKTTVCDGSALWMHSDRIIDRNEDNPVPINKHTPPSKWREALGVICVCAITALFVRKARTQDAPPARRSVYIIAIAAVFFIFAAALTLSHTFFTPNGLGVYGGKAKLFYLCGGIPDGFFTAPEFSTYQPAYPPGLALLTLVSYLISGGCGEWLTQLIPVFASAVALWTLCHGAGSVWVALWILAAFLSRQNMQMTTLYYAEPFMALLVIIGWERIRKNDGDWRGWLLIGAAGLFKNEGLVILCAVWAAWVAVGRAGWRFAIAVAPSLLWHIACRFAGATLYDYAPAFEPDRARFFTATAHLLKIAFLEPWRYGFAFPLALVALFFKRTRSNRTFVVATLAAMLCLIAFAFVFSLSRAPDFKWHLDSSATRLLWVPALLLISEIRRCRPAD